MTGEEDEPRHTFGDDDLSHEELMYLLRPDSYPKPLHWRVQDEKGLGISHERLMAVLVRLPEDYEPYGECRREGDDDTWLPDCSIGCRWFVPLSRSFGSDWGVCANPRSHRRGLLTFEHQGCAAFEGAPELVATLRSSP